MARYIGLLSSDLRGKVGGAVGSRATSGTTLRRLVAGTQPTTAKQVKQRQALSFLGAQWRQLTSLTQQAWNTLATNVTLTNSLGQQYSPTGQQLFMQCQLTYYAFFGYMLGAPPSLPPAVPAVTALSLTYSDGTLTAALSLSTYTTIPIVKLFTGPPRSYGTAYLSFTSAKFLAYYPATDSSLNVTAAWISLFGQVASSNNVQFFARAYDGASGFPGAVTAINARLG